jgi:uncharacterized protein (TIGR02271 family)
MSLHVDPAELAGRLARDAHGRPLGEVETVFSDAAGTSSRFVGIDTDAGRVVVPVEGAEVDPSVYALDLPYMVDRISGAPTIAPEVEELDAETERRVVEHFGVSEPETRPVLVPDAEPDPEPEPARATEPTQLLEPVDVVAEPVVEPASEEVVLTEEQLVVETERVPAQHVRVRKEIVEEEVTVTVVLRHEELVIEREPIAPGEAPAETAGGPRLDEPPIEIVLWAEEPVVTTRAVPTERVRVLRTLGSQQQDLTAQLRRERASFDHATGDDR